MSPSNTSAKVLNAVLSAVAIATMLQHMMRETSNIKEAEAQNAKKQLGPWYFAGRKATYLWGQPSPPLGPQVTARLADKFCGINEVHLSRVPYGETGTTCWSILLGIVHPQTLHIDFSEMVPGKAVTKTNVSDDWSEIPLVALVNHESQLCVKISRATLMTLFALTNARPIYRYSSAAGHRSAYPSYCGQWTISWPIGKPCIVRLAPHDSHNATTDVYPPSFPARIDKCVEMMAGIISDGTWKVAFPGRAKHAGPWLLQERPKGFGGAHGTRHLYNMQGGTVFEVDLLALVPWISNEHENMVKLEIPALGQTTNHAVLYVPKHEAQILAKALDCLPWSSLSWSLHRGLKDVLLAHGKPIMNQYRVQLASVFQAGVPAIRVVLIERGWASELVDGPMASMAESAILSGSGNSGDLVRIVVAIVECLLERVGMADKINLDRTDFWSRQLETSGSSGLAAFLTGEDSHVADMDILVALTKFFVLEWSQELDYQLYHDLPVDILLA